MPLIHRVFRLIVLRKFKVVKVDQSKEYSFPMTEIRRNKRCQKIPA